MQVIEDQEALKHPDDIRRLVFCTGKVAIDLVTSSHRTESPNVAICRVEQLYPLPVNDMVNAIERFPHLEDVLWLQEEPENMGAWDFVRPLVDGLAGSRRFAVIARPRSSSPAEGSATRHAQNQDQLIASAFEMTKKKYAGRSSD